MPLFSIWAPYGLLKFSGAPSSGEDIYRSVVAAQSDAFDMTKGTESEAEGYATSMALARVRAVQDRAANQRNGAKAVDMLPALEGDYGVTPGVTDTIPTRQANVAARQKISRGPRAESIEGALRALLGADFIDYRALLPSESSTYPTDPSLGPGVFGRNDIPTKLFQLTAHITVVGIAVAFTYARYGQDDGVRLLPGDIVAIQAEHNVLGEKLTIATVSGLTATATFTNPHDVGATITTGPIPIWTSTQRHVYVVVSAAAAVDPETRRQIDDVMGRISRGITSWSIVSASSPTTLGPFVVGPIGTGSPLGTVPIGTVTIP